MRYNGFEKRMCGRLAFVDTHVALTSDVVVGHCSHRVAIFSFHLSGHLRVCGLNIIGLYR